MVEIAVMAGLFGCWMLSWWTLIVCCYVAAGCIDQLLKRRQSPAHRLLLSLPSLAKLIFSIWYLRRAASSGFSVPISSVSIRNFTDTS